MKIRLRVDISGSRDGTPWPRRGEVVDLPQDEAVHMCSNGMAVPVVDDGVQAAVVSESAEMRAALTTQSAAAVVPSASEAGDAPDPVETPKKRPGRPRKTAAVKSETDQK